MRHIRGRAARWMLVLILSVPVAGVAHAQQAVPQQPVAAPAAGSGMVVTRSIWPGAIVTIAACGLALFAICRSSARN